ncbi:MAG TPA: PilZ domain-containing protein [Pyrinomonadaceae bacterium]
MSGERRNNVRKKILLEAKWESMSRAHEARVDDVSLGGCFVNTYGHVELNEPINLQLLLPTGEWVPLQGQVATYQPGVGFGMSFSALSGKQRTALNKLISSISDDA